MKDSKGKQIDEKFSLLEKQLATIMKYPGDKKSTITRILKFFKSDFKKKWTAASYKHDRFIKNNEQCLKSNIKLPYWSVNVTQKPGRPSKSFTELSDCSKRRKTKTLREQVSVEELTYAARVSHSTLGNTDVAKVIKEITATPTRANKYRKVFKSASKKVMVKKYTLQEALALFVEGDFTRKQWELIQSNNKNIYPCYSLIQKAKKKCYPDKESIKVTENTAEIQLQALLDHTALRLYKYVSEVVERCSEEEQQNMVLISKWGCDGSKQAQFKQKFQNSTDNDANIFQSSLVPLRLIVIIDGEQKKIIWQNPVTSSPRFCRPIRIRFISESKDIIVDEIEYVKNQITNLKETKVSNEIGKIKHTMMLTMVDGKVCNAATDTTSTMRCYICGQTSKDFNKFIKIEQINTEALSFGLSVLHARIRFFESILHLAYKIPLQKWQAQSTEEKKVVKETKEKIQRSFKEELGLLVDIPKAGFGNTNDGNTSRRFFADPESSSRITGVNLDLIKRLHVILEVISSGQNINANKFEAFAHETAKKYIDLYGWHPMSPTMHKVLMHGAEVVTHAILPIGQLSEEAAEARNKHFRQYRQNFSRKFSRIDCNTDVLNRLLLSSDPYISSCRSKQHKKTLPFSQEAVNMMTPSTHFFLPQAESDSEQNVIDEDEEDEEDLTIISE